MTETNGRTDALHLACHGARVSIRSNRAGWLCEVLPLLPPCWTERDPEPVACTYLAEVAADAAGPVCTLTLGPTVLAERVPLNDAPQHLASSLHVSASCQATDALFVHAGVVGWEGRAILLPGRSHAGKTTLVQALVKAGATYYSDEFAVLDEAGRVHPYARPLAVRDEAGHVRNQPVASIGGTAGTEPLPVGSVLALRYEPGAPWAPRALTPSRGALRLFENTVMARTRAAEALELFGRVMDGASAWEGSRDDAGAVAPRMLRLVRHPGR